LRGYLLLTVYKQKKIYRSPEADFQHLRHFFTTLTELTISTLRNIYFFKAKLFIKIATALMVRMFLMALS